MKYVSKILDSGHTILTYDFLQDILGIQKRNNLKAIVKNLLKAGIFIAVKPGMRRLSQYNSLELANKLRSPSYISLETVLQMEGMIFQDYSQVINLVGTDTLSIEIDKKIYRFRKLKESLLLDPTGIVTKKNYFIATKERALLDILYYVPKYHIDHLPKLDMQLIHMLLPKYPTTTQEAFNLL